MSGYGKLVRGEPVYFDDEDRRLPWCLERRWSYWNGPGDGGWHKSHPVHLCPRDCAEAPEASALKEP